MSVLALKLHESRDQLGLKGPRAAEWLVAQGVVLPTAPNTWVRSEQATAPDALLVARLGTAEFFLEGGTAGTTLKRMSASLSQPPSGVYPVLREDWIYVLSGERVHDVLAQVCNVNFAALSLDSHPVIMTLMIGVAVLIVPRSEAGAATAGREYRMWCDPTFGPYLGESLGAVVIESGGRYTGVSG